jgi:hypothetical protein
MPTIAPADRGSSLDDEDATLVGVDVGIAVVGTAVGIAVEGTSVDGVAVGDGDGAKVGVAVGSICTTTCI